jgi:hypothetical protein
MKATQKIRTARGLIAIQDVVVGDQVYGFDGEGQVASTVTAVFFDMENVSTAKLESTYNIGSGETFFGQVDNLTSQVITLFPTVNIGYGVATTAYTSGTTGTIIDYSGFDYASKCAYFAGFMDYFGWFSVPAYGNIEYAKVNVKEAPFELLQELIGGTFSTVTQTIGTSAASYISSDGLNQGNIAARIIAPYTNVHGGIPYTSIDSLEEVVQFRFNTSRQTNYRLSIDVGTHFILDCGFAVSSY